MAGVTVKLIGKWYHAGGKNQHGVHIKRHATGLANAEAADAYRLKLEDARQWPLPEPPKPEPVKERLSIAAALERRILKIPEHSSSRVTNRRSVTNGTIHPLAALKPAITMIDEVTSEHLESLQNYWRDVRHHTPSSIRTYRDQSNSVFKWALDHNYIPRNPWKTVSPLKGFQPTRDQKMKRMGKNEGHATLPLDMKGEANWLKIQSSVTDFIAARRKNNHNPLFTVPGVFLTLLQAMYETGLRRDDAILVRADWIVDSEEGGSYYCIQMKTGEPVTCYLPQYLVDAIRRLPLLPWRGAPSRYEMLAEKEYGPGAALYPFYDGSDTAHNYLNYYLGLPLRQMGRKLGFRKPKKGVVGYNPKNPFTQNLRPHRFRDSFAVNMLNLGMSLFDLKIMLGHKNIATTEKYYTPFVIGMSEAIEKRLALARRAKLFDAANAAQTNETHYRAENHYALALLQ